MFLGSYLHVFEVMLAGRFVFGTGAETLLVLQFINISQWFTDHSYTLAIGICQFVSISMTLASGVITPRLAERFGIAAATGAGAFVAIFSLVFVFRYVKMTREIAEETSRLHHHRSRSNSNDLGIELT